MRIDHIGFITRDVQRFEAFWCSVLKFECKHISTLSREAAQTLFGIDAEASIKRYFYGDMSVEIHDFGKNTVEASQSFARFGINHFCFYVSDRDEFIKNLPSNVAIKVFDNPGGWKNIFIRDYEDNWIELRTTIKPVVEEKKEDIDTKKIFTTSYDCKAAEDLISSFVACINPVQALEIGTQQGKSAVLIAKAMKRDTYFTSCDLFQSHYDTPPYKETHADQRIAGANMMTAEPECKWQILMCNGMQMLQGDKVYDLLHIDICNHYDNLKDILPLAFRKVTKGIILEGGIYNRWQRKYKFRPYNDLLSMIEIPEYIHWRHITIPFNDHNAVTLLTRNSQ